MARPRNPKTTLVHALDESVHPIYLLDSAGQIAYANPACAGWLGCDAESLPGQICQPSPLPLADQSQNQIRGMLPPTDNSAAGTSHCRVFATQADGGLDRRSAWRVALNPEAPDTWNFYLVEAAGQDENGSPSAQTPNELLTIRELIAELASEHRRIHDLAGLVGVHPMTRRLRKQLEAAGHAACDVLIRGSSGQRAEHFARIVYHLQNPDARQPPVFLDGRLADQEQIQEAVGSLCRKPVAGDRREAAILLLSHADRLTAAAQMELAGFLKLPGDRLRVIATCETSLSQLAESRQYDSDLALRLATIEVVLPRLIERRNDIPALAAHFLEQSQEGQKAGRVSLAPATLQWLTEFNWPGDLEQLRTVVFQAAARAASGPILPEHLPELVRYGIQAQRLGRPPQEEIDLDRFLAGIEKQLIERALLRTRSNKAQAAKLLGITRTRLLRRCEQLGLNMPDEPIDFRAAPTDADEPDAEPEVLR